MAEPGENVSIVSVSESNSCYRVMDHGYCTDEVDGCNCNGREVCNPPGATGTDLAAFAGCVHIDPPACDQDENLCTIEMCCGADAAADEAEVTACLRASLPPGAVLPFEALDRGLYACSGARGQHWVTEMPDNEPGPVSCIDLEEFEVDVPIPGFGGGDGKTWANKVDVLIENGGCEDGNDCTLEICNPFAGAACSWHDYTLVERHPCDDEDGERTVPVETPNMCAEFVCSGGACAEPPPPPPPNPSTGELDVDCPEAIVIPPPEFPPGVLLVRDAYDATGAAVGYVRRPEDGRERVLTSCHNSHCDGIHCAVIADTAGGGGMSQSLRCPPPIGCIEHHCSITTEQWAGDVIGCSAVSNDNTCQNALPADTCLVSSCQADGSCLQVPDNSQCPVELIPCEAPALRIPLCTPEGLCSSECRIPPI